MKILIPSIIAQLSLIIYFQVVEWIDLTPWNNIMFGNGKELLFIIVGCVQVIILTGFMRNVYWIVKSGLCFYFIWLLLQIFNWWIPYFFGASPEYLAMYQHYFSFTYKFLPPVSGIYIPDANHVVLQTLILINVGIFARAIFKPKQKNIFSHKESQAPRKLEAIADTQK